MTQSATIAVFSSFILLAIALSLFVCWDKIFEPPYGEQPFGETATLEWSKETFTVLQIADTQIGDVETDVCKQVDTRFRCSAANTTRFVRRLVQNVRPDVVVFTGDQLEYPRRPQSALRASWGPVKDANVPFVVITGNHDISRCDPWDYKKYRKYVEAHALLAGTSVLKIMKNNTEQANLWFFDYHYDSKEATGFEIHEDHLRWFKERSNVDGVVMLHVPPKEVNEWPLISGVRQEEPEDPNSGLVEILPKNIRAVAFGHDHTNDYCVKGTHTLCYAGGAGYTTYGRKGWPRRARVFEFYPDGRISTHKILDGETLETIDAEFLP